ncbi:O-acetyl-ADP-ribose deacetylase (regulator of RNase III), contains Macro domain [Filimonas lacunae]|uniref:O-acetyl-ADP-ribose deacetylase (Regulator of RNase III), contains Macro domain n=1 Tax=Filimonas lacunae TaxID=477680 RepID=A0A173MDQ4_9BACT|nr:macro domain-containing protein [Filimonas lacunae]BAV05609.1 hypothetical protein FLA_1620 [Filimonas lacunae]SIT29207.1 O-acetyl-ADP-ribose deacetylase (regulator of RNase III), contains Macro domain [Filimonas lacunae]
MEKNILYVKGDATAPVADGNKLIVHICNDMGRWGKGFVLAISKKWKSPEKEFKAWYKSGNGYELGAVQFVQVEADIWIANVIGQHSIYKDEEGMPPIRYNAIATGLEQVGAFAVEINASVHMPRIGCGLAGGTWDKIEPLIESGICNKTVPVTVYDYEC